MALITFVQTHPRDRDFIAFASGTFFPLTCVTGGEDEYLKLIQGSKHELNENTFFEVCSIFIFIGQYCCYVMNCYY